MKATHQQMQAETIQKLTPVLSAAQLKKFQVLEQMEHQHFHHRGPPPGDGRRLPSKRCMTERVTGVSRDGVRRCRGCRAA